MGVGKEEAVAGPEEGAYVQVESPLEHPKEGVEEEGYGVGGIGVVGVCAVPQEAERGGGVAVWCGGGTGEPERMRERVAGEVGLFHRPPCRNARYKVQTHACVCQR